jgi:hypothetical protein
MWARPRATRRSCLLRLALAAAPAPAIRDCRRQHHRRAAAPRGHPAPHTPRLSLCRQQLTAPAATTPTPPTVTPWCERKSRRGAMGRINTQGFACPNRTCTYYQIIDAHLHALVGDGAHGRSERIQTLRSKPVAPRSAPGAGTPWVTPLYRLKTASLHLGEVLTALALGSMWPPPCAYSDMATPPSRPG